jgi:hypothetical protein
MAKKFDPKAKAKRQKIILAVLGVVFVGVLAWQVPGVLKMMNEKPPPTTAPPPPAATPVAGTPVSATGTPVAASGTLVDSDPAAQAAGGQLVSFDRFESKDPFAQQMSDEPTSAPAAQDDRSARAPQTPGSGGSGSGLSSTPRPSVRPAPRSAEITVNGTKETVSVGGTFPASDPMFVLVSVTRTSAKVGISGGSLEAGKATVTLQKGKKLTLENTVDGSRYVLVLVGTV